MPLPDQTQQKSKNPPLTANMYFKRKSSEEHKSMSQQNPGRNSLDKHSSRLKPWK